MPGRKFLPMLLHRESWLQCLMVPKKRPDLPYTSMLRLFLLTSLFKGLVREATMVPACHGTELGWNLHNAGAGQEKDSSILERIPTVMSDLPQTLSEELTGPASSLHHTAEEWQRWEDPSPPKHTCSTGHPRLCPHPLKQCLFSIPCSIRWVTNSGIQVCPSA